MILSDAKMFEFSLEFNAKTRLKNNIITEYTVDSTNYFEFYDAKLVRLKCETGVSISMISSENTAYSVDNTVEYKSRLRQAWELSKEGRNEEALLSFIQLQKDFPENSSAHYFEGYIHTRLGHFDKAIKAYEKSLKLPSDNYTNKFSIMLNLMELYLLTGQRLKVESMEKVIYKDGKSRERFLATFLVHINTKVAGKRDGNREKELRDAVKYLNLKSLNWNFNEILTWLKDSSATELSKKYVASWIENLTVRTD
ncbi:MAG: tetratricopeptide repeat protein [Sphingobacteriaceae bacterium]|nr:MAG: tetratricopeptide repeat protein [Sphingobacteriaceae bacterium]